MVKFRWILSLLVLGPGFALPGCLRHGFGAHADVSPPVDQMAEAVAADAEQRNPAEHEPAYDTTHDTASLDRAADELLLPPDVSNDNDAAHPDGESPLPDGAIPDEAATLDTGVGCAEWANWQEASCGTGGCTYTCTSGGHSYALRCTTSTGRALCDCSVDNGFWEPCGPAVNRVTPCDYPCSWYFSKGCCNP